jgi:hypothetical protein
MNAVTVCSSGRRKHDASAGRRREQAPALYLPVSKVRGSVECCWFFSSDQMSAYMGMPDGFYIAANLPMQHSGKVLHIGSAA